MTTTTYLLIMAAVSVCTTITTLVVAVLVLSAIRRLEKQMESLAANLAKEKPVIVLPPQGGQPQLVYSDRVEVPPIVDRGEEERRRRREYRNGYRSNNPLEEDREPIIVE